MRYYSAESAHGSSTSFGFSNDTVVYVWESREERDKYLSATPNLSARAIRRSEVIREAANWSLTQNRMSGPDTFAGEYWGITPNYDLGDMPKKAYGQIEICSPYSDCEHFYK